MRLLRKERGWSQDHLCRRAGISKSFLSEVENDAATPGGPMLVKLAGALGASLDYLMTGVEPEAAKAKARGMEISPSLATFAQNHGLPFRHVVELNNMMSNIEARRRHEGAKDLTEADWSKLYDSVRVLLREE